MPQAVPVAVPVPKVVVAADVPTQTLSHVDEYLRKGQESGASDIHLPVNCKPTWRRFGNLEAIWLQAPMLAAADTERLAMGFLDAAQQKLLHERGDVDFAYANSNGRFRASVVRHRLGIDMVFRIINTKIRTMDDLGLPPTLKMLTQYQNGLILVTGSVGSGKSTTLSAMVMGKSVVPSFDFSVRTSASAPRKCTPAMISAAHTHAFAPPNAFAITNTAARHANSQPNAPSTIAAPAMMSSLNPCHAASRPSSETSRSRADAYCAHAARKDRVLPVTPVFPLPGDVSVSGIPC